MHHVTEAHLCEGKLKCWAGALLPFFTIYAKKTTQTPLDKQTQNPIFVIFVCVSWYFFSWFFTFKFYTKKYRKKSKLLKKQPFFKSFMSRERSRSCFFLLLKKIQSCSTACHKILINLFLLGVAFFNWFWC